MKRLRFFLIIALLAGVSFAGVKYVAVVETDIDAQSGVANEINSADIRLVTAELRREAVKNLPRDKYNVMTTETVYAQGSAVLEECADENCVIALGSKIGADYIVRGTVSKIQTMFTLTVEIYETEDGNLVASSDPVRSGSILEMLEKAASVCAEMYRTFASTQRSTASAPALEPIPKQGSLPSQSQAPAVINVPSEVKSISEAMKLISNGGTVRVAPGVYRERVVMAPGAALVSTLPFGAKIDGGRSGVVITMAERSSVTGFDIRNGAIGILCGDSGGEIRGCRVLDNRMTGILVKRNLPQIEDNIIAFNGASGIQAWNIRVTAAKVSNNTIAYNGNNGIAVGGSSAFAVERNVIAFNEWHGLKMSQESERVTVIGNNIYGNLFQFGKTLPNGNYAFDPAFLKPFAELNFKPDPDRCCKDKGANGENLGAR